VTILGGILLFAREHTIEKVLGAFASPGGFQLRRRFAITDVCCDCLPKRLAIPGELPVMLG